GLYVPLLHHHGPVRSVRYRAAHAAVQARRHDPDGLRHDHHHADRLAKRGTNVVHPTGPWGAHMARRSNGEGSIHFRAKQNLWCGAIQAGSQRRWIYGKSRKEVAQKLSSLQQSVRVGNLVRPTKLTVAEYLETWITAGESRLRP